MKGKYHKASLYKTGFIDYPNTSAQEFMNIRMNDTSKDTTYPNKRFTSIKNLSDGSSSMIYEGINNENGDRIIIKKISKGECWRKELEVLKKLQYNDSGLLLKFIDFYESNRYSYIITEFHEGFDLFEHIDLNVPYTTEKALLLTLYMAKCIKECHDMNIIHLDIKCENYMVKEGALFKDGKPDILLIDFGHSEIIPEDEPIEKLRKGYSYGTNCYTCPEGYFEKVCSSKSDIWSLGICMALLLTGDYPFKGDEHDYYLNSIIDNVDINIKNNDILKLLKDSINSFPDKRPNINEFIVRIEEILSFIKTSVNL